MSPQSSPGQPVSSVFLAATLRLLPEGVPPVRNLARVRVHIGPASSAGRVTFLDRSSRLLPGEQAVVQFHLDAPLMVKPGDPFTIQASSTRLLLGDGEVLHVGNEPISRFQSSMVRYLRSLAQGGSPRDIEAELRFPSSRPPTLGALAERLGLSTEDVRRRLDGLGDRCVIIAEGKTESIVHRDMLDKPLKSIRARVERYHAQRPIRLGMGLNQIRKAMPGLRPRWIVAAALDYGVRKSLLGCTAGIYHTPGWEPRLNQDAQRVRAEMLGVLAKTPYQTPSMPKLLRDFTPAHIAREVLGLLQESQLVTELPGGVILLTSAVKHAEEVLRDHVREHGTISVSELRDRLGTSRKYVLPLLEYFDRSGITERDGDRRVLRRAVPIS